MAKLTPNQAPGGPSVAGGAAAASAPAQPIPFATGSPAVSRKERKAKDKTTTAPRISKQEWFDKNFSGNKEDVLQVRRYQQRGGFKCAACNIPGSYALVIRVKDGAPGPNVQDLEIFGDPTKGQDANAVVTTVRAAQVGRDCLKTYGGVNPDKLGQ